MEHMDPGFWSRNFFESCCGFNFPMAAGHNWPGLPWVIWRLNAGYNAPKWMTWDFSFPFWWPPNKNNQKHFPPATATAPRSACCAMAGGAAVEKQVGKWPVDSWLISDEKWKVTNLPCLYKGILIFFKTQFIITWLIGDYLNRWLTFVNGLRVLILLSYIFWWFSCHNLACYVCGDANAG